MKKYILYSFLTIFAFSTASFGDDKDGEDRPPYVQKIKHEEIPLDVFLWAGRPGGLSPQAHNPKKKEADPLNTRGTTFYISKKN
ncbi:hypothetical protein QM565_02165 [Geitlerinema splendidum]|jgi:hypothetical protein|nr:hypothetical protein [Geitlerinema splendidum]